jgi:hypothetical protein
MKKEVTNFFIEFIYLRKPEIPYPCADITYGKKSVKEFSTSDSFHYPASEEQIQFWWQCLQDLNNFRRKIKKLVPEVPFLDIENDLSCLDKVCTFTYYRRVISRFMYILLIII